MKFSQTTGIISYGTALPSLCLLSKDIEDAHHSPGIGRSLGIKQKTVADTDEDTITLATQAVYQAIQRSSPAIAQQISALFIGSESHPYAVKPSGTVVANAVGLPTTLSMADLQFACKAGTQALQVCLNYVESGAASHTLAVGADTAQGAPGDALEYTAAAGAAAFIVGSSKKILAHVLASHSYATDTPDFWRRPTQTYPQHAGRFSGEPAFMNHIITNTKKILEETHLNIEDFSYVVFHTPNKKFPQAVALQLGCSREQLQYSLIVEDIGNTYAAASLLSLANVLDHAAAHQKILVVSYGSGAGSDAFILETTEQLVTQRKQWTQSVKNQIEVLRPISYSTYLQHQHI